MPAMQAQPYHHNNVGNWGVDLGHHNNFALNITCNLFAPMQHWLDDRRRAHEEKQNISKRSVRSGRTRRGISAADSHITRRIEELFDANSRRSGGTGHSSSSSKRSQPLSATALRVQDQSNRSKRSSGRTSAPDGRSRRALTETESVTSRLKNLLLPALSGGGRSRH